MIHQSYFISRYAVSVASSSQWNITWNFAWVPPSLYLGVSNTALPSWWQDPMDLQFKLIPLEPCNLCELLNYCSVSRVINLHWSDPGFTPYLCLSGLEDSPNPVCQILLRSESIQPTTHLRALIKAQPLPEACFTHLQLAKCHCQCKHFPALLPWGDPE